MWCPLCTTVLTVGQGIEKIWNLLNWLELFLFILLLPQCPSARHPSIYIDTLCHLYWDLLPNLTEVCLFLTRFSCASLPWSLCCSTLKVFFPQSSAETVSIDVWIHFCRLSTGTSLAAWPLHSSVLPPWSNFILCKMHRDATRLLQLTGTLFATASLPKKCFSAPTATPKHKILTQLSSILKNGQIWQLCHNL